MTSFKRIAGAALLFACIALPAFAVHPPQAKLLDSKTTPACVKARPSWLPSDNNSGPAVSVIDKCKLNIMVDGIVHIRSAKGDLKDRDMVGTAATLTTHANGYIQYIDFHFKLGGDACFADAPPAPKEGLACASVVLRPEDGLIVPIAWGLHYQFTGHTIDDPKADVSVDGWMVNPADPAQALDIITREAAPKATGGVSPGSAP